MNLKKYVHYFSTYTETGTTQLAQIDAAKEIAQD